MGDRTDGWPWSTLGVEPTTDREAIHAAYAARKAALDAAVMRVSAFAELSEAREKALFLAAEMRRAAERGEEPVTVASSTPPEAPAPTPPLLPPEPEDPPPPVEPATQLGPETESEGAPETGPEVNPKPAISGPIASSSMATSLPARPVATPAPPPPPPSPPAPMAVVEREVEDDPEPDPTPPTTLRVSVPVTKDREAAPAPAPEPRPEPTETRPSESAAPSENLPTLEEEARDLLEFLQLKSAGHSSRSRSSS